MPFALRRGNFLLRDGSRSDGGAREQGGSWYEAEQ
jgi:hypothetical protein